jgi:hypothetical protein
MRRLLLLIALSVMGAGQMKATPLACSTGQTLAYYETTYTSQASACSIAGLDFYDFSSGAFGVLGNSGPGTTPFTTASISITPVNSASGVGFMITPTSTFQATATGVRDVEIPFQVACDNGTACLSSVYMSISGSATASGMSGGTSGADALLESYCAGGVAPPPTAPCSGGGVTQATLTITPSSPGTLSQTSTFSAVSELAVSKDIQALGNNGSATVTSVEDLFSSTSTSTPVPEPSAALMLGGGLLGLALLSIRRRPV